MARHSRKRRGGNEGFSNEPEQQLPSNVNTGETGLSNVLGQSQDIHMSPPAAQSAYSATNPPPPSRNLPSGMPASTGRGKSRRRTGKKGTKKAGRRSRKH
jgi:hypothetical protein